MVHYRLAENNIFSCCSMVHQGSGIRIQTTPVGLAAGMTLTPTFNKSQPNTGERKVAVVPQRKWLSFWLGSFRSDGRRHIADMLCYLCFRIHSVELVTWPIWKAPATGKDGRLHLGLRLASLHHSGIGQSIRWCGHSAANQVR